MRSVTRRSWQVLFTDWRRHFEFPLPFFVVQLANWNALATAPVDSGWARLRDAQRRAVAEDGNAGLAVTIDIGNRDDIHPTNKQDVGKRLARAARHVVFGEKISASGAQPKSVRRTTAGVEVTLGDFDGRLLVIGARDPAGFELCGDRAGELSLRARATGRGRRGAARGLRSPKRPRACASAGPTRRCATCSTPRACPWGHSSCRSNEPRT